MYNVMNVQLNDNSLSATFVSITLNQAQERRRFSLINAFAFASYPTSIATTSKQFRAVLNSSQRHGVVSCASAHVINFAPTDVIPAASRVKCVAARCIKQAYVVNALQLQGSPNNNRKRVIYSRTSKQPDDSSIKRRENFHDKV